MKKLAIVLVLLFAATALFAQSINLGDFPPGRWLDSNYDAIWEFSATNIRILNTDGSVAWDFAGKTINGFRVFVQGGQPAISFSCPEAGRTYTFVVNVVQQQRMTMKIERSGLEDYSVGMPRQ